MTATRGGTLLGVLFLLVGLAVTGMVILNKPIATIPLCVGIATALLGALMIDPTAVKSGATDLGGIVGPYMPGGRRATDPVVAVITPPADKKLNV
jgi:hypothetical protein